MKKAFDLAEGGNCDRPSLITIEKVGSRARLLDQLRVEA
jgi:hypothetical protein